MKKINLTLLALFLISSCAQKVIKTDSNIDDLRMLIVNMRSNLEQNREEISNLRGTLESSNYENKKELDKKLEEFKANQLIMAEKVKLIEDDMENQKEINKGFYDVLQQHETWMSKIGKNIPTNNVKKDYRSRLKLALKEYQNKNYKNAYNIFKSLESEKSHPSERLYKILVYNLSLTEFRLKMYKDSYLHFEEILNDYQKSKKYDKYIPSTKYHMGVILLRKNDCRKAQQFFDDFKRNHSNHPLIKKVKQKAQKCLNLG